MSKNYISSTRLRFDWRPAIFLIARGETILVTHINSPVMALVPVASVPDPEGWENVGVADLQNKLTQIKDAIESEEMKGVFITRYRKRVAALVGLNFEGDKDERH
jgi:antitoxin (DNA-binding transcriptional repressor) of toxin-antitoxin stability system